MSKRLKREFHCFLLTDYEKEEEFLRKKHQEGFKLVKVGLLGRYYFEECEGEDVVYRLDFNPQSPKDRESYLQMYSDYGWEYIQDVNQYSYFRRSSEVSDESEMEIFSDNMSKLDMLKRIFVKRMLVSLALFLLCGMPSIIRAWEGDFTGPWGHGYTFFLGAMFGIYIFIIIHCGIGFFRLWKKYRVAAE